MEAIGPLKDRIGFVSNVDLEYIFLIPSSSYLRARVNKVVNDYVEHKWHARMMI